MPKSKESKKFCKDVFRIPQIIGTCWFNAIIMMIFYSQYSRKLLLNNKPFHGRTDKLSKTFKSILYKRYKEDQKTIDFFNKNNIHNILHHFNLEPELYYTVINKGYFLPLFITNLFNALNTQYLSIDFFNTYSYDFYNGYKKNFYFSLTETIKLYVDQYNQQLFMSFLNNSYERERYKQYIKEKIENYIPSYLIINIWSDSSILYSGVGDNFDYVLYDFYIYNNYFNFDYNIKGIENFSNEIIFNHRTYILDSVSLANFNANDIKIGHAIAGISCKNKRYVYNGWVRNTVDPALRNQKQELGRTLPCELLPYEWDINKEDNFCLKPNSSCNIDKSFNLKNDLCFSFNKGDRTLIYVLKNDKYQSLDYNKSTSNSSSHIKPKNKRPSLDILPDFRTIQSPIQKIFKTESESDKKEKSKKTSPKTESSPKIKSPTEDIKKDIKKEITNIQENIKKYNEYIELLNEIISQNADKLKILLTKYKKLTDKKQK